MHALPKQVHIFDRDCRPGPKPIGVCGNLLTDFGRLWVRPSEISFSSQSEKTKNTELDIENGTSLISGIEIALTTSTDF